MAEDISVKILSQASDNIQRLFELSTRIDERVKLIQGKQDDFDDRIERLINSNVDMSRKIAVLESRDESGTLREMQSQITLIEKRLSSVEHLTDGTEDRWKQITSFVVQMIWIILAAWLLMKMNLNPPPVP